MTPNIPFPNRAEFLADRDRPSNRDEMFNALCIPRDTGNRVDVDTLFFEYLISRFDRAAYGREAITAFRMVEIHDHGNFLGWLRSGGHMGGHWTEMRNAAALPDAGETDPTSALLARADIPLSSVDWGGTFALNFKAPWRREILVTGPIDLLSLEQAGNVGGSLFHGPISLPADDGSEYARVP